MEENKKIKCKGIAIDSLVKIEISGGFAAKLQALMLYHMQTRPTEEVVEIIHHLKNGEPKDEFSDHLLTLLVLIQEIEKQAANQNLMQEYEVDPTNISGS